MTPLSRTSALLCGGTAGIGLATAKALARAGVPRLLLVGRTPARGVEAVATIQKVAPDANIQFASADVTTAAGAAAAVSAIIEAFGSVDLLVNTGGGTGMPELFHRSPLEVLPMVSMACCVAFAAIAGGAASHVDQRGGVILNVASDAGKVATPGEAIIGAEWRQS